MPNTEKLLYQTEKSSHRRCSIKKAFLKISQYSEKNACVGVSSSGLLKRDSNTGVLLLGNF